jgi:hypothetical protein
LGVSLGSILSDRDTEFSYTSRDTPLEEEFGSSHSGMHSTARGTSDQDAYMLGMGDALSVAKKLCD